MGVGEGAAWLPATPSPALPPHVAPLGTPRGMAQSPAKGAAWFLLQQQFSAGEPQAVLTQAGPLLFGLQVQWVGGAGPTTSCTVGGWQKGQGLGWLGSHS